MRQHPRPALDLEHLAAQTGGDATLQREILALFVAQSARILAALEDSLAPPRAQADLAHLLKGSARAVGAFALAEAADVAEAGLRSGHLAPAARESLLGASEAALAAIRTHLAGSW